MKRVVVFIFMSLTLTLACQSESELEVKQAALAEKEQEMAALNQEINTLKEEIASLDTTEVKKDPIPVSVSRMQKQKFRHFTELTGSVTSRENVMLSAEASGRVISIPAREGQKVSSGQVLVRLENQAIANQLNEVKSAFELAEITYQKRKRLWDQQIGSEIEYLQAKSNYERSRNQLGQVQSQYNKSFIKSPISGTVDNIAVNKGELVSPGRAVARVVDLDKVQVEAEISEEYLSAVSKGDSVTITIPALNISQRVPVAFVGQVINPENRSFTIKVNLNNKSGKIKPNVLANISIQDYMNPEAIVVPSIAVKKDLKGDFVYVIKDENGTNIAHKKQVKTGRSLKNLTEIISGLEPGDLVVTTGFDQIAEGTEVSVK